MLTWHMGRNGLNLQDSRARFWLRTPDVWLCIVFVFIASNDLPLALQASYDAC